MRTTGEHRPSATRSCTGWSGKRRRTIETHRATVYRRGPARFVERLSPGCQGAPVRALELDRTEALGVVASKRRLLSAPERAHGGAFVQLAARCARELRRARAAEVSAARRTSALPPPTQSASPTAATPMATMAEVHLRARALAGWRRRRRWRAAALPGTDAAGARRRRGHRRERRMARKAQRRRGAVRRVRVGGRHRRRWHAVDARRRGQDNRRRLRQRDRRRCAGDGSQARGGERCGHRRDGGRDRVARRKRRMRADVRLRWRSATAWLPTARNSGRRRRRLRAPDFDDDLARRPRPDGSILAGFAPRPLLAPQRSASRPDGAVLRVAEVLSAARPPAKLPPRGAPAAALRDSARGAREPRPRLLSVRWDAPFSRGTSRARRASRRPWQSGAPDRARTPARGWLRAAAENRAGCSSVARIRLFSNFREDALLLAICGTAAVRSCDLHVEHAPERRRRIRLQRSRRAVSRRPAPATCTRSCRASTPRTRRPRGSPRRSRSPSRDRPP